MFRLSDGEEIMTLAFFVLIQYRSVTDGQTDRRTDISALAIPSACIARYANALVKTRYVCLSVCMLPMAGRTTGPIKTKLGIGTHVDPRSVLVKVKVKVI